jgi:hypothetical protein
MIQSTKIVKQQDTQACSVFKVPTHQLPSISKKSHTQQVIQACSLLKANQPTNTNPSKIMTNDSKPTLVHQWKKRQLSTTRCFSHLGTTASQNVLAKAKGAANATKANRLANYPIL